MNDVHYITMWVVYAYLHHCSFPWSFPCRFQTSSKKVLIYLNVFLCVCTHALRSIKVENIHIIKHDLSKLAGNQKLNVLKNYYACSKHGLMAIVNEFRGFCHVHRHIIGIQKRALFPGYSSSTDHYTMGNESLYFSFFTHLKLIFVKIKYPCKYRKIISFILSKMI